MTPRLRRIPLELWLLPWLVAAVWAGHETNRWLEARKVELKADGSVGVLPNGAAVRVLSLGFERLMADLFWVRTVYYVGDPDASRANWPAAEPLANLVTDIDPTFDSVYVLMSSVLSGLRGDHDAAIRLLEKGAAISKYWRIHFLLGFEYFMEKEDYVHGAQCLERAVALGGPYYLQFLVSRLYASAGDPTTAMQFIAARLKNEENPGVRAELEQRYSDIWINRDLAQIDDAIAKFRDRKRAGPKNVGALVDAGFLATLPRDPKGGEYFISDGKAATRVTYKVLKLNLPGLRTHGGK
jgi:hypothetical protein